MFNLICKLLIPYSTILKKHIQNLKSDKTKNSLFFLESSWSLKTNSSLETVINPPLQSSQSTNHENSGCESIPESFKSNLSINFSNILHCGSFIFNRVQFGNHSISRVRNNGTNNTSQITRSKSHRQLSGFAVFVFRFGSENVSIESLHNFLEEDKFGNGVRDLSGPERG